MSDYRNGPTLDFSVDTVGAAIVDACTLFGDDTVFNGACFSEAFCKRVGILGPIDGYIVRGILGGRSDVEQVGRSHYARVATPTASEHEKLLRDLDEVADREDSDAGCLARKAAEALREEVRLRKDCVVCLRELVRIAQETGRANVEYHTKAARAEAEAARRERDQLDTEKAMLEGAVKAAEAERDEARQSWESERKAHRVTMADRDQATAAERHALQLRVHAEKERDEQRVRAERLNGHAEAKEAALFEIAEALGMVHEQSMGAVHRADDESLISACNGLAKLRATGATDAEVRRLRGFETRMSETAERLGMSNAKKCGTSQIGDFFDSLATPADAETSLPRVSVAQVDDLLRELQQERSNTDNSLPVAELLDRSANALRDMRYQLRGADHNARCAQEGERRIAAAIREACKGLDIDGDQPQIARVAVLRQRLDDAVAKADAARSALETAVRAVLVHVPSLSDADIVEMRDSARTLVDEGGLPTTTVVALENQIRACNAAIEARAWVRRLVDTRIVTCVYCGHAFPPGTEAHGAEVLKEHIRVCEKHPMRELESELKTAREALNAKRCLECGCEP